MHARARVYVVQRGGDRRGWMILTKKRFLFLHRRVSRFATPLYGIYFYIGKKYSRNREWGREGARTRDGTGHGVWSAGSRWTESGGDHDHEGGNARNGAERENKGKERERERERERGGEKERDGRTVAVLFTKGDGGGFFFLFSPPELAVTFRFFQPRRRRASQLSAEDFRGFRSAAGNRRVDDPLNRIRLMCNRDGGSPFSRKTLSHCGRRISRVSAMQPLAPRHDSRSRAISRKPFSTVLLRLCRKQCDYAAITLRIFRIHKAGFINSPA